MRLSDVISYKDVTEHDTNNIPNYQNCIGIYVGGTGSLVLRDVGGNEATFSAIPVGTVIWGRHKQIRTGSTATLLVALYDKLIAP